MELIAPYNSSNVLSVQSKRGNDKHFFFLSLEFEISTDFLPPATLSYVRYSTKTVTILLRFIDED